MCETDRCPIPADDALYKAYHDTEWGIPTDSDQTFYEKVCLEGFQSGLSWRTILHRRAALRRAFADFDIPAVADFDDVDIDRLMQDAGIIRNRRKICSAINNARRALELQRDYGSLAAFFWQYEPAPATRPASMSCSWLNDNPTTPESSALAGALKKRGWTYVGPTNMYALMQALGLVNDHVSGCSARLTVQRARQAFTRPGT
ncbi:DNA-3-methyladenine glycosylase I [Granulosicoccus sp. 3-233]|uniref:DNA-3-methyladenine glycosylase I n=1 Tax=Granulosicoccus sp. 3-233 TaxID=3417969 RepID=UPI003D335596